MKSNMKLNWKKLLITCIIVLTISFGTVLLLNKMGYDFKVLSNDSGFDADYGGGYDGGYDSGFDYDYGGSNGSGRGLSISFGEFIKLSLALVIVIGIVAVLNLKADEYLKHRDKRFLRIINRIALVISLCCSIVLVGIPTIFNFIIYVITMLPSIIICIVFKIKEINRKPNVEIQDYTDISNEKLQDLNYKNIDELKTEIYNNYVAIQIAWMNNSIEDVRHLLSDEIFNTYKSQLFTLNNKNQQNIMSDFKYIDSKIHNIKKTSSGFIIETTLEVTCKDYIIDVITQKVLRGSSNLKRNYLYSLKFKIGTKTIENCPNCHAKLTELGSSVKCSYCGNVVVRNSNTLVLIDKKMLRQEVEY